MNKKEEQERRISLHEEYTLLTRMEDYCAKRKMMIKSEWQNFEEFNHFLDGAKEYIQKRYKTRTNAKRTNAKIGR